MAILQDRAREVIKSHGGLRKAAKALRLNHSTLLFLAKGRRRNATEGTLRKLGLTRDFQPVRDART